jgi:hypothetical protein
MFTEKGPGEPGPFSHFRTLFFWPVSEWKLEPVASVDQRCPEPPLNFLR